MKESLQIIFGKANKQESIVATKRKVDKEAGLKVTQL